MTKRPAEDFAPASLGNGSAFTRPWLSLRWGSPGQGRLPIRPKRLRQWYVRAPMTKFGSAVPEHRRMPATCRPGLISGDPHTRRYDLDTANEIRAQFGPGSALTPGPDRYRVDLHMPQIGNDAWSAVLYVMTAQIQGAVWSQMLGPDIDNPFRSGTVRRVVEGVTLYSLEGD